MKRKGFQVFVSHSTKDESVLRSLVDVLSKRDIRAYVAEWNPTPGMPLADKVLTEIDRSSCVVALFTKNGLRSNWVHQEIGYALKCRKPILPIVEKGTTSSDLGALVGKEYVGYDTACPEAAITKVADCVRSIKKRSEEQGWNILIGGVIAFLTLLSLGKPRT